MHTIGVISDNHGYTNPQVFPVFENVDMILHAGDIGNEDVITALEALAPVYAVYGNVDTFPLTTRYPEVFAVAINDVHICMLHQLVSLKTSNIQNTVNGQLNGKLDILIYGHTHSAKLERLEDIYLFNPGSAGKRRFSLRPAVGLIHIFENGSFTPEIIYLSA